MFNPLIYSHININHTPVDVEADTPPPIIVNVADQTLLDGLGLKLGIERKLTDDEKNVTFESVEDGVNIGDQIRVKLETNNPDSFRYVFL